MGKFNLIYLIVLFLCLTSCKDYKKESHIESETLDYNKYEITGNNKSSLEGSELQYTVEKMKINDVEFSYPQLLKICGNYDISIINENIYRETKSIIEEYYNVANSRMTDVALDLEFSVLYSFNQIISVKYLIYSNFSDEMSPKQEIKCVNLCGSELLSLNEFVKIDTFFIQKLKTYGKFYSSTGRYTHESVQMKEFDSIADEALLFQLIDGETEIYFFDKSIVVVLRTIHALGDYIELSMKIDVFKENIKSEFYNLF